MLPSCFAREDAKSGVQTSKTEVWRKCGELSYLGSHLNWSIATFLDPGFENKKMWFLSSDGLRQQVHAEILGIKKMEVMMIILCLLWKIEPPSEGAQSFYLWGTVSKNCILTAKQRAMNRRGHFSNNLPPSSFNESNMDIH